MFPEQDSRHNGEGLLEKITLVGKPEHPPTTELGKAR